MRIFNCLLLLRAVANVVRILTTLVSHGIHARQLLPLHLLHHLMLLACADGHEYLRDALNENEDESAEHGLLEGDRATTTDGEHSARDKARYHRIHAVIFLPHVDEHALATGEDAAPQAEVATQEWRSVPYVAEARPYALVLWSVEHTYTVKQYKTRLVSPFVTTL